MFDGNVKVERYAQQTDAAQLSRNLLLAPKGEPADIVVTRCAKICLGMRLEGADQACAYAATVNVKPNLQIVADDVKCSHGCAVSDLEEEQLFYFR